MTFKTPLKIHVSEPHPDFYVEDKATMHNTITIHQTTIGEGVSDMAVKIEHVKFDIYLNGELQASKIYSENQFRRLAHPNNDIESDELMQFHNWIWSTWKQKTKCSCDVAQNRSKRFGSFRKFWAKIFNFKK